MRRPIIVVLALALLFLTGCDVILDGTVWGPRHQYAGVIVNNSDYTLIVTVREHDFRTNDTYRMHELTIPAHSVSRTLYLEEKYYTFEATRAFSGQRHTSRSMHVTGVRGTRSYDGVVYDWIMTIG